MILVMAVTVLLLYCAVMHFATISRDDTSIVRDWHVRLPLDPPNCDTTYCPSFIRAYFFLFLTFLFSSFRTK